MSAHLRLKLAQADLSLRWADMSGGAFSYVAVHVGMILFDF